MRAICRARKASARGALALDPNATDAHALLARIDAVKGSSENAKADLRAEIAANPGNIRNYLLLERYYEKDANWQEAKKICEKARDADPSSPVVANELAYLYLEHGGDVHVALSLARMAKEKLPNAAHVSDTLGWAYYKSGIADSAVTQLRDAVQHGPEIPLYRYHLGMAFLAAGRTDEARQSLRQALAAKQDFEGAAEAKMALEKISSGRPPG